MRIRYRLAVLGAAAVTAAAVVLTATPAAAANLLTNPGFESGSLSGWSCSAGSVVTSPVHSGSYALAGNASGSDTAQCTQTVTVQPNTAYTLSAWVRGNYVYLGVSGGAQTWATSDAYTKLTVSFTTGAGQTSAQVFLHGWYGTGAYNADDVALDGPGTPPPNPGPGAPGTPGTPSVGSVTSSSIALSWSASSGTVTGFPARPIWT
jgi:hypothetical protein